MFILDKLFKANPHTLKVKEAIGFNPKDVGLIEENGVTYGFSYQDNGNGSSKVKLLISPLYQPRTYECDMDINVANEFKGQLSLTLIEDSTEIDEVGIIFPEEGTNKEGKKYIKGLTFNTYKIKHSTNTPSVEHLGKTKLQKNANDNSLANKDNSYFQPRAVKVDNGNVIIIVHNLKDQTLVFWYLESNGNGKFKALRKATGIIERKLFKFDNLGQLVLNGNTMLYTQMRKEVTEERKTQIFKFDLAKVVQNLKDGKGTNECLLSKKGCQIDNKALFFSSKHEISFLQHVKQIKGNDLIAFLATGQSPDKQNLHLINLVKNGSKSSLNVDEFEDSIEQLYVKDSGRDGFIVTAINGENIIILSYKGSEKPHKVTIIPANNIKALSDFVNIINGRLTLSIISSSTLSPITTGKVEASTKTSTTAINHTTETDTVETTQPSTAELTTRTSTVRPTTPAITSQATTATTDTGISTGKPTPATISPTSTVSNTTQFSTEPITQTSTLTAKLTTVAETTAIPKATAVTIEAEASTAKSTAAKPTTSETTVTSRATTVTERAITSTHAPIINSEKTTQAVFTMPSTKTKKSTTPISTTTLFSQFTSSVQPARRAIAGKSNEAGIIAGSTLGVGGIIIGIIGFIVYKYVQRHRRCNAVPELELFDLESNSSREEILINNDRTSPEIVLDSLSIESSRSSSPSLEA